MNRIKNKLRSRAGASMIMAMVFMLFCSFIGGTVLASATANAQRVAQMAEQQDFLLERSAALLATDQLKLKNNQYLRLTVVDQKRTIQAAEPKSGIGLVLVEGVTPERDRVITFTVSTNITLTEMHKLMLQSSVWRYLVERVEGDSLEAKVLLSGFTGDVNQASSLSGFLYTYSNASVVGNKVTVPKVAEDKKWIGGSMAVKCTSSSAQTSVQIPEYTSNFSIGRNEDIYDFFVDFGENSQVKMKMNAFSGINSPLTTTTPTYDASFFPEKNLPDGTHQKAYPDVIITSVATTTTISWEDPLVEKGGAGQ
jgi:hypothetical protein